MKKDQIILGETYLAKVTNKVVPVRIDATSPHGGWNAINLVTNKPVRIKSAQRLRSRSQPKKNLADTAHVAYPSDKAQEPNKDAKAQAGRDTSERGATGGQPNATAKPVKGMSLLDAAAHILSLDTGDIPGAMRCKDLVDLAVMRQLWMPGPRGGKTPASTLYAAILREITTKGTQSRFVKTERGKFTLQNSQSLREQAASQK